MSNEFAFVAGDLGAANAMVPVMRVLTSRGASVIGIADIRGVAATALATAGVSTFSAGSWEEASRHVGAESLMVVGTSATATDLERECATQGRVQTALFSDGYFNHANAVWRSMPARTWLVLDEGHAAAVRSVRGRVVDDIIISGQPAFDDALALMLRKSEAVAEIRARLGVSPEVPLMVWWATGMGQLAAEDAQMLAASFGVQVRPLAIACRMHPKLEKTVGPGTIQKTLASLYGAAGTAAISWVDAADVPGIELCLAADVLLSITCTEDIKSTLVGGPPVVHLLGPKVRTWMREDLFLSPPHYLPDVASGLALAAYDERDVPLNIMRALNPAVRRELRTAWQPPDGPAAVRTADILQRLA